METKKEFEIRLFDAKGVQILVVPVIASGEAQALARAQALCQAHDCAHFKVRGLMRSARYDGAKGAFAKGEAP